MFLDHFDHLEMAFDEGDVVFEDFGPWDVSGGRWATSPLVAFGLRLTRKLLWWERCSFGRHVVRCFDGSWSIRKLRGLKTAWKQVRLVTSA